MAAGAKIDIVLGDGRLSLEREKRKFDVLAMDAYAFSNPKGLLA